MQFFYRLGHNIHLSQSEFEFLTNSKVESKNDQFFLSSHFLPANQTGGVVYMGEVLGVFEKNQNDKIFAAIQTELTKIQKEQEISSSYSAFQPANLQETLVLDAKNLQNNFTEASNFPKTEIRNFTHSSNKKKIGFCLPLELQKKSLNLAKRAGFSKISSASFVSGINFGHWKKTTNWIIGFILEKNLVLGRVSTFTNQEFWSDLDNKLPHLDMKRGVINLKLARSLNNLNSAKNILDPFAGQGRVAISALDIKQNFILSDIDNLTRDIQENYNFGVYLWQKNYDLIQTRIAKVNQISTTESLETNKPGIVTEGFLGENFLYEPSQEKIAQVWQEQEKLWLQVLTKAKNSGFGEAVFCLPFYKTKLGVFIPEKILEEIKKAGYLLQTFSNEKNFILYSRQNTITGHLIVKVVF